MAGIYKLGRLAANFWYIVMNKMIEPNTPIEAIPLAVLDVETTGLRPEAGDRICEIAILNVDPCVNPRLFASLVNPGRQISPAARAVNGIADQAVAEAPPFDALVEQISARLKGVVIVGHNASFDLKFLWEEYRILGAQFPKMPIIDTLHLARSCFRFPRNNLGDVAMELGVPVAGLHRAEGDVWATYHVLKGMISELRKFGCHTLGDVLTAPHHVSLTSKMATRDLPGKLLMAIRDGRPISIRYAKTNETNERVISPLWLADSLLIAYCHLRKAERTFRLDCIVAAWWPDETQLELTQQSKSSECANPSPGLSPLDTRN